MNVDEYRSINKKEVPIKMHLLYSAIAQDSNDNERDSGIVSQSLEFV
jgi:hypothetical protein